MNPTGPSHETGGLFVTATDTGVGKTFVACALVRIWLALGRTVAPRKPVESGCALHGGEYWPADGAMLAQAAGIPFARLHEVTRFRLSEPLAPDQAARLAGQRIRLEDVVAACAHPRGSWRITEGAGGFYSPLCEGGLNADLAQALGDPLILVAEDRLGTLSGCLLAAEAMQRRGLYLAGVVLNRGRASAHPALNNAEALTRHLAVPVISIAEGTPPERVDQSLSTWSSSMVRPPEPGSTGSASRGSAATGSASR